MIREPIPMKPAGGLFRTAERVEDPARELVESSDDFSFKVSSNLDKRFWVRVEREMEDGMLVVTDCSPGGRPLAELSEGLTLAVRSLRKDFRGLVFRDIVPGGDQVAGFPAKLLTAADLVKQVGAMVAEDLETSVAGFDMRPRRGKIDASVVFAR